MQRSRWFVPGVSLGTGLAMLGVLWSAGHPGQGLASLGIMAAFGALVLLGGRSETIRALRGDGRDERFALLDLRATAFAGNVVIVGVIVGWMVEVARDGNPRPFALIGVVGAVAYILAVVVQRIRG